MRRRKHALLPLLVYAWNPRDNQGIRNRTIDPALHGTAHFDLSADADIGDGFMDRVRHRMGFLQLLRHRHRVAGCAYRPRAAR
jgi:hypothetical protein